MPPSPSSVRCSSRASPAPARPSSPARSPPRLGLPLLEWHVKSTTKAAQGLYEYDAVSRLRDSQLGDARVHDVRNYIRPGPLWRAFARRGQAVLLIDEIDKADIEFPNDLLQELDRMEFFVYETGETVRARTAADRRHHLEQREGAARRLPAPLLLPLHPLPRRGDADPHRRGALPRHQAAAGARGADPVLRDPRDAGPEEEALDLGGARLAEAAPRRGPRARGPAPGRGERAAASCTARCSRTSRTSTSSSASPSWRGAADREPALRDCRDDTPATAHAIVHCSITRNPLMFKPLRSVQLRRIPG